MKWTQVLVALLMAAVGLVGLTALADPPIKQGRSIAAPNASPVPYEKLARVYEAGSRSKSGGMTTTTAFSREAGRSVGSSLEAPDNPMVLAGPAQPLPFSHQTHVALGLECATCHAAPAPGAQMTLPPTGTCMACHSGIATERPAIQSLARYHAAAEAVPWIRVYRVMPGITWSHAPHLRAGMTCTACHGEVAKSPVMQPLKSSTTMGGCIQCHTAAQAKGRNAPTRCEGCHSAWKPGAVASGPRPADHPPSDR